MLHKKAADPAKSIHTKMTAIEGEIFDTQSMIKANLHELEGLDISTPVTHKTFIQTKDSKQYALGFAGSAGLASGLAISGSVFTGGAAALAVTGGMALKSYLSRRWIAPTMIEYKDIR